MWPISLRLTQLHAARPGDTLHFVLPDGRTLQVIHDSKLARPDGEHWLGHLKAGREFPVRLRLDDALAAGVIRTPDGGYVIGHVDGVQLIGNDLSAAARPAALDTLPSMFAPAADAETAAGSSSGDRTPAGKPADVAHLVALDLVAMSALEPGADMALSIPEHGDYRVTHDRTDAGDTDSTTWIGHLKDYGQEFRVIITSGPNGSVGNILTPSGELLLVDSGGSQWLVDPVRSGLSNPEPDHADAIGEDLPAGAMAGGGTAEGGTSAAAGTTTTSVSTTTATSGTSTTATLVDVLVLYTPGFKARNGSVWATRISQLIALSNQAYTDSGVPMRLRLVGTEQIGDSDKTGNSTTLSSLAKGTGVYKTVPALRKKYGADMVTLIRPFYMSAQGGNCGVGYIGGYNGSNIAGYGSYAYSVVSDGKDAGGSNYYCTDYTFTHELGHNMGLMHDRDTVARQGGGKGSYDYAFGHGRSGSFGTIMSYISPVIGRFSNPTQTTCGGSFACGVVPGNPASAHNALALTNNRTAVAAFTGTTLATTYQVSGTISRAGKALPNVPVTASNGGSCTPSGKTGAYACTVASGWSGVIAPVVTGRPVLPGSLKLNNVKAAQTKQNFIVR
ncbi:MAG: hypothetical protein KBF58_11770 [Methyloversatilis sp.]|nr:hypothetical protein [Methyloversatilis sp.]MBP6195357.1 hypothetical protein [Methyloversatilis sp.]MBP9118744.1 hypothetical protein [Methyloversatilis sp.]